MFVCLKCLFGTGKTAQCTVFAVPSMGIWTQPQNLHKKAKHGYMQHVCSGKAERGVREGRRNCGRDVIYEKKILKEK